MSSKYRYCNIVFLYCNLFVFKILGLLPWQINFSSLTIHPHSNSNERMNNDTKKVISVSIWGLAYSVMLIIGNCLSGVYAFQCIFELNKSSSVSIIIKAVHSGLIVCEILRISGVLLLYILHKNTVVHISEQLIKVGRLLNNSIKYNWQITPRIVSIFSINIGISLILTVIEFGFDSFIFLFCWYMSTLVSAWVLIQYALILEVINHQLKMINNAILNCGNISDNIKERNIFISKLPMRDNSECHIVNFKYVYIHICEILDKLSHFYAIPVLSSIIYLGTVITFVSYFNFYKFYVIKHSFNPSHDVCNTLWLFIIASAIITLITTVNSIKKEISIIPDNIHWLLNLCSMSENMENALIDFSHDLLSRKINFTTYGIISLDGSLLFSILGSSITNLVIFLQFQL